MAEEFKPGDVVQLKSGGPTMTIEEISTYDGIEGRAAKCKWFDKRTVKEDVFALPTLVKAQ